MFVGWGGRVVDIVFEIKSRFLVVVVVKVVVVVVEVGFIVEGMSVVSGGVEKVFEVGV